MNSSRILLVDDEAQLRRAVRTTLSALGFVMSDTDSGETALGLLRTERFDLVLLDINLPGVSGIETCRAIRARSEVSILMLTVRDRAEDRIQALDAGADGYVTKPFDVNELVARIRAALRRAPKSSLGETRVLLLENIEISFRDRSIKTGERLTRLTPKEMDLLHYFVSNANSALAHDRILQAVWGPDYGDEVEYLRVFVNQLRKKIEPDPSRPRYIVTEPWLGYRFCLPAAENR
jgi:two-component system KDP operon response regulator KdpE